MGGFVKINLAVTLVAGDHKAVAVAEFKKMSMNHAGFRLAKWFTREDFMDYGFILAEELVLRQEYYDAFILLEQIIRMEYSYAYFRLFFPEVMELAANVLKNHLEGKIPDELALDCWERALELGFGKSADANFLRKMAAAYRRMGDLSTARICEAAQEGLGQRRRGKTGVAADNRPVST